MAAALNLAPLPGVTLRVEGDTAAVRHAAAEYGDAPQAPTGDEAAELLVRFVDRLPGAQQERHKSIAWSARLEWSGARRLVLSIALRGRPRWFGLSLVQGYLVEPALSLLAVEVGGVLLPAAGLVRNGAALLLIGRSGAGKSSLALRALAAGLPLLGDDQVFVAADGTCTRFPRRLRLYDDAPETAPSAIAGLPGRYRAGLMVRRAARALTGGFVAPSLAVPPAAVPGANLAAQAPLGQVVLLSRGPQAGAVSVRPSSVDDAVERCREVLDEQRRRLLRALAPEWSEAAVASREDALLRTAFTNIPIIAVEVPTLANAGDAVSAVARELNLP